MPLALGPREGGSQPSAPTKGQLRSRTEDLLWQKCFQNDLKKD